ncbi:MAG: ABC transporter permease [Candidatus Brocadiaceae bacterium]|nr:ABC transporter permease [Candidatus Brocadiaceae bacterium]
MAYTGFIAVLLVVSLLYVRPADFAAVIRSADVRHAAWLTTWTSLLSALLALGFALPVGYALSRFRLPGRAVLDTLVDVPIILPHLVVGVALLIFFRTALGRAIQGLGLAFVYAPEGIVLAQFVCVSPYAVRTVKAALDAVDPRIEDVARTLGWPAHQVFLRVTLPMIRNGIVAGGVIAWALAMGLYGPLMVFAGTTRSRTEVMATSVYLELSVGRIGPALAIAILLVLFTMACLLVFKRLAGRTGSLW